MTGWLLLLLVVVSSRCVDSDEADIDSLKENMTIMLTHIYENICERLGK